MKKGDYTEYLFETLKDLEDSKKWLKRSYDICHKLGIKDQYSAEEFDAFENLCSRFSRTSDIILQKTLRGIDKVELEDKGTLIDSINRAHKRGLVSSADKMREIRELRNEISHEYTNRVLKDVFGTVLEFCPVIFEIIDKINQYSERFR